MRSYPPAPLYALVPGGRTGGTREAQKVQSSVSDNGIGIDSDTLGRIFSNGFTTKKDGHGFGLHSSALAAKQLGGTLEAASDGTGSGATFVLTIPLRQAPKDRETQTTPQCV